MTQVSSPKTDLPVAYSACLHRFSIALVVMTFVLLVVGGVVTSKGVGLSVPDWPTTMGHNMLTAPPSVWWHGGMKWEHSHRLLGIVVGVMCIAQCICLIVTYRKTRKWMIWAGVGLLAACIAQGVMGGLRVTEMSTGWAIFHGIFGQLFLCFTVFLAAATSRYWLALTQGQGCCCKAKASSAQQPDDTKKYWKKLRALSTALFMVILIQLCLGSAVRHLQAGLAIPDFPMSYGRVMPPMSQQAIVEAMDDYYDEEDMPTDYYTPKQVHLNFTHRLWALVVVLHVALLLKRLWFSKGQRKEVPLLDKQAGILLLLLFVQVILGITVITSGRSEHITTTHQTVGAIFFAVATLLAIRVRLLGCYGQHNSATDCKDKDASAGQKNSQASSSQGASA